MPNRHDRRQTSAAHRSSKSKGRTLNQNFERALYRIRAEFERVGEVQSRFECVSDDETFDVPVNWPDRDAKRTACSALRDAFRRRGVKRYLFASESWVDKTTGSPPADDPDRGEIILVIVVELGGPRRYAFADITRNEGTSTLGPWQISAEVPQTWLMELLQEGHSDRAVIAEQPPVGKLSTSDLRGLIWQLPPHAAEHRFDIHSQLEDLIADQIRKGAEGVFMAVFLALERVLYDIVKEMGSPSGLEQFALFLRDHPDLFPMFPTVSDQMPSTQHVRSFKDTLRRFRSEKHLAELTPLIFEAFMNMYMNVGSHAFGALDLARRIEDWCPEQQAKLKQAGLRSSFELDDDEGRVFFALSAEHYPFGVLGRRDAIGDLFVSSMLACNQRDFATAVDNIKQSGFELIVGSEANELISKMGQIKGRGLRSHKD